MIKAVLKAIVPRVFLKKGFLVYNRLKIKTIDRIFFPPRHIPADAFYVDRKINPFLALRIPLERYPTEVQQGLKIWTEPSWSQDEYLLTYNSPGYIHSDTGWAMTPQKSLIYPSLGFSHAPHVRKPDLLASHFYKRKIVSIEKVISLRDTGEENYFHFFNDVLPKLFFVRDNGFDLSEYVVVVSDRLFQKAYFRSVVDNSWLKNLRWHVQRDEWVAFEKAIFCKPLTHTKKYFTEILNIVKPEEAPGSDRRVFLTRPRSSVRFVENMDELQPVLEKYGFDIVDSGQLTFSEQVRLFSECRFLVGVHGAGLTNMIFRSGKPLSILEIVHPFEYIPFHYIMLARQFDYQYDVILGRKGGESGVGGFVIDPAKFELAVRNLIR